MGSGIGRVEVGSRSRKRPAFVLIGNTSKRGREGGVDVGMCFGGKLSSSGLEGP